MDRIAKALFEPESIAFIGASTNVLKWGFNILHHIVRSDFTGRVYPVNPQTSEWYGRKVYRHLEDIHEKIDLAVIVVKDTLVPSAMRHCAEKKIPAAIVITAGFSETGEAGATLEREVVQIARTGGVRFMGPNTMGIFSGWPSPLHALMPSMPIKSGNVGIIAQSGNLGSSIAYRFTRRDIGLSRLISSGNEADLMTEDFLEMLENDDHTKVICLYVEGVRDGRRFFETAKRITRTKPIILLKGGRTAQGAKAAMSHTGAIASDDTVFSSMCRQTGIIQVDTMDEMIDVAGMLVSQPLPKGGRMGIITLGGGWGVIATDMCAMNGLDIPPLDSSIIEELDKVLPPFWSRGNPVDLVAPNRVSVITDSVRLLAESGSVDSVLIMGLGYMMYRAERVITSDVLPRADVEKHAKVLIHEEYRLLDLLCNLIEKEGIPIVPVIDLMAFDSPREQNIISLLDSKGIMAYSCPDRAIHALAKVTEYARHLED
jgi:acyl-CoA synthetase (NDP forming)